MANLSDFERLLPSLSPGEEAQILKWVVQDLGGAFPGVDSCPDVCGGEPCIVGARIPVWLLERARRLGAGEEPAPRPLSWPVSIRMRYHPAGGDGTSTAWARCSRV